MANARLKDRQRQIPNGFTFIEPSTGWDSVKVLGRHPSFDRLSAAVLDHYRGNQRLAKKNSWPTDLAGVEQVVEAYNVQVCLSNGWHDFVVSTDPATVPKQWPLHRPSDGAVAGAKRSAAGVKLVVEWLGSGLKPVAVDIAQRRAAICAACPQNKEETGFLQRIGALAAQQIKTLAEVKNDLALRTTHDAKLFVCQACDCKLDLKVHSPLNHILNNTSEDTKKRLDPKCWILSEK